MDIGELVNSLIVTSIEDNFDGLEIRIQKGRHVIEITAGKIEEEEPPELIQ